VLRFPRDANGEVRKEFRLGLRSAAFKQFFGAIGKTDRGFGAIVGYYGSNFEIVSASIVSASNIFGSPLWH
jgi:hypothetical protein